MSGKSRRNSILKSRGDGGSGEINAQDWENGATSRNLTGLLKRRVSFSQTNQVKEFERSNNSSSDTSASATNDGPSMDRRCDNLDMSMFNDSILDGMEKENNERFNLNETCYDGEGGMDITSLGDPVTDQADMVLRRSPRRKSVSATNNTIIGGDMDVSMVYESATRTSAPVQSENMDRIKTQSDRRKSVSSRNKTICEGDMEMSMVQEPATKSSANHTLSESKDIGTTRKQSNRRKSASCTNKTTIGGDMEVSILSYPATSTSANKTLVEPDTNEAIKTQSNSQKRVSSSNKTVNGGDMEMTMMQDPLSVNLTRFEGGMEMTTYQSKPMTSEPSSNKTIVSGDMDVSVFGGEHCEVDYNFVPETLPITPHKLPRSKAVLLNETACSPGNMEMTLHREDRRQSLSLKNKTVFGGDMDISLMRSASNENSVNNETVFEPANMEMTIHNSYRRKSVALNNKTIADGDMEMSPFRAETSRSIACMDPASYASPGQKSVKAANKTITWGDMNMSLVSSESQSAKQEMSVLRSSQRKSTVARNTTVAGGDMEMSFEEQFEGANANQTALDAAEMDMSILPSTCRKSASTSSRNKTIIGGVMDMTSLDGTAETPYVTRSKMQHLESQSTSIQPVSSSIPDRDPSGTVITFGKVDTSKPENIERALGRVRTVVKKRSREQQGSMVLCGLGKFASAKTPKKRTIQDSRVKRKTVRTEAAKEVSPVVNSATAPSRKETREIAVNTSLGEGDCIDVSVMTTPTITQAAVCVVPVEPKSPRTRSMMRTKVSSGMSPMATNLMRKSIDKQKHQPELSVLVPQSDSGSGKGSTSSDCDSPECKVVVVAVTPSRDSEVESDGSPQSPSDKHENAAVNHIAAKENNVGVVSEKDLPTPIQPLSASTSVDSSKAQITVVSPPLHQVALERTLEKQKNPTMKPEIPTENKDQSIDKSPAMMEPNSPRTRSMTRTKPTSGMSPMATKILKKKVGNEKRPKEQSIRKLHSETDASSGDGPTCCDSSPVTADTEVTETPKPVTKPNVILPDPQVDSTSSTKSISLPKSVSPPKQKLAASKLLLPSKEINPPKQEPATIPKSLSNAASPLKVISPISSSSQGSVTTTETASINHLKNTSSDEDINTSTGRFPLSCKSPQQNEMPIPTHNPPTEFRQPDPPITSATSPESDPEHVQEEKLSEHTVEEVVLVEATRYEDDEDEDPGNLATVYPERARSEVSRNASQLNYSAQLRKSHKSMEFSAFENSVFHELEDMEESVRTESVDSKHEEDRAQCPHVEDQLIRESFKESTQAENLPKVLNKAGGSSQPEVEAHRSQTKIMQNPPCTLSSAALDLQRQLFDASSAFAQLTSQERTTYETLISKSEYLSDLLPSFAHSATEVEILEIFRPQEIRAYVGENYVNRVQRAKASWLARQRNHPTIFSVPIVGDLFKQL